MSNHKQTPELFFIKLAKGEYGLKDTFWNFGVLINLLSVIFLPVSALLGEVFFVFTFSILFMLYSPFFVIGLIEAAKNYRGKKIWKHLAMFYAGFWALMFLAIFILFVALL